MSRTEDLAHARERIDERLATARDREEAAREAVRLLHGLLPAYAWAGVYWLQGETLVLGTFAGEPTEHTRIPVGKGVCGTAVAENRNLVVEDVSRLSNYLSCSLKTRSEIVVLIRSREGKILGQIDIDGHETGAFTPEDEAFLSGVAAGIAAAGEPGGR